MQEQFSYSLMASGLGILIVFSILVLLSVLMMLIRFFSDNDGSKKAAPAKAVKSKKAGAVSDLPLPVLAAVAAEAFGAGTNSPDWVGAAVAAYLASEDDDAVTPRASSWSAGRTEKYDPWVANNKLSKTAPGA